MVRARKKKHTFGGLEIEMVENTVPGKLKRDMSTTTMWERGLPMRERGTHFYSIILTVGRAAPIEFPFGSDRDGSNQIDAAMDEIVKEVTSILNRRSGM